MALKSLFVRYLKLGLTDKPLTLDFYSTRLVNAFDQGNVTTKLSSETNSGSTTSPRKPKSKDHVQWMLLDRSGKWVHVHDIERYSNQSLGIQSCSEMRRLSSFSKERQISKISIEPIWDHLEEWHITKKLVCCIKPRMVSSTVYQFVT